MIKLELRAWDRKNKKMFDVFQWNRGDEFDSITRMIGFNKIETLFIGEDIDLIQFTGLLDKQGNKIYEGDIVKSTSNYLNWKTGDPTGELCIETYQIIHLEEEAQYTVQRIDGYINRLGINQKRMSVYYEVIGNIYQNPELLEEKEDIEN